MLRLSVAQHRESNDLRVLQRDGRGKTFKSDGNLNAVPRVHRAQRTFPRRKVQARDQIIQFFFKLVTFCWLRFLNRTSPRRPTPRPSLQRCLLVDSLKSRYYARSHWPAPLSINRSLQSLHFFFLDQDRLLTSALPHRVNLVKFIIMEIQETGGEKKPVTFRLKRFQLFVSVVNLVYTTVLCARRPSLLCTMDGLESFFDIIHQFSIFHLLLSQPHHTSFQTEISGHISLNGL